MFSLVTKSVLAFAMVTAALVGTGMSANADATPSYVEKFINATGPAAQQVHQEYNIPASVIIAQAADESRYGRSILSKEDNNYFGIKCKSKNNPGSGPATGCKMLVNPKGEDPAYYRVYKSETDSLRDYGAAADQAGRPLC